MQQKLIIRPLLFLGILTLTNTIIFCQTKTNKNCSCDYFPMCNYTAEKLFGQEVYYGLNGSEKNGTYYNCKNGTVTVKWFTNEEYLADRRWEWRNDINDYGYVDYIGSDTKVNTKILYKFNLQAGGEWKVPTNEGKFENYYRIEEKLQNIRLNGKSYSNVLKVSMVTKIQLKEEEYINEHDTYSFNTRRYIYLNTFYYNGEVYKNAMSYFFDKNEGLVKEEDNWNELKNKFISRIDGMTTPDNVLLAAFKLQYKSKKERIADSLENLKPTEAKHSFTRTLINNEWKGSGMSYVFLEDGTALSLSRTYDSKTKSYAIRIDDNKKGKWRIIDCNNCQSDINVIVQINWYGISPFGGVEQTQLSQDKFDVKVNYTTKGNEYYFWQGYLMAKALDKDLKKIIADAKNSKKL